MRDENDLKVLYQIWWHCEVTISINTLSNSMIASASSPCTTLYAMTPYKRCLSNQLDKFKNSENETCLNCNGLNQSCDKDQACIGSCQYKCITPSECRSISYPLCSTPSPTYCTYIPGTDICYNCNPGWIMSTSTPGLCEITVPGCKTFNTSSQCTACQPGYYITATAPKTCILCPDGCEICYLNSLGSVVCSKCPEGQIFHTSPLCVSNCPPTFYANTLVTPNECAPCHPGCKYCSYNPALQFAVCSECTEGYFLMQYINTLTSTDPAKPQFTTACIANYYGDSSATPPVCKPCRDKCQVCTNNTDCSLCIVGYMLSADTLTCIGSDCIWKCRICSNTSTCDVCSDGSYLHPIDKKCYPCSWDCARCTSSNNCLACISFTRFTTPEFSECRVTCVSYAFTNPGNTHSKCAEYSSNNLTVKYCSYDSNSISTCNNCLSTQAGTSECPATICPAYCRNCNTVDGAVTCIHCTLGYYIQPDKRTCNKTCPDFYHAHVSLKTCVPCKANCKRCVNYPYICEECEPGYSLANDYASC